MNKLYYIIAFQYLSNRKRQTITSIFAVSISVAVYIIVSALVNGNELAFIEQAVNTSPHIIIHDDFQNITDVQPADVMYSNGLNIIVGATPDSQAKGIADYENIVNQITTKYQDVAAAAVLKKTALLKHGQIEFSSVNYGIMPQSYDSISNISDYLYGGRLENLEQEQYGIILGNDLAKKLKAQVGDYIDLTSSAGNKMRSQVVALLQTGIVAVDYNNSYLLLNKAQALHGVDNITNEIHIKTNNISEASSFAKTLQLAFGYPTKSWMEMAANIFTIFKIQRVIIFVVVFTVLFMACIGIYTVISTIVYEKYRDIAIFKSMGFNNNDLRMIFLLQGIIIALIGIILGWLIALAAVKSLGSIKVDIVGFVKMDHLVLYHSIDLYITGAILAFVMSILGTLISIKKAIKVNPVEIIRVSI